MAVNHSSIDSGSRIECARAENGGFQLSNDSHEQSTNDLSQESSNDPLSIAARKKHQKNIPQTFDLQIIFFFFL